MNGSLLRIFIAGPSSDLDRCESAILAVRKFAIVTFDWAAAVRANRDAGIDDADITPMERFNAREAGERGLLDADVILWLAGGSEGAAYEVGFARALNKGIVVAGRKRHPIYGETIVAPHAFNDDASAIAFLADYAIRRMRAWSGYEDTCREIDGSAGK